MVTRLFSITYNGQLLSEQVNKYSLTETHSSVDFTANFIVTAADPNTLRTTCETIKSNLSARNKDLTLVLNGTNQVVFSHSGNTGFLGQPTIEKVADEVSTMTSRHYRFSCSFEKPAEAALGYRREGQINVNYNEARRVSVTFTGLYTAGASNSASENFLANYPAWTGGILSALGLDFERRNLDYSYDYEDKLCDFTIVYEERIENDIQSGDSNIIENALVNYILRSPQVFGTSPIRTTTPNMPPASVELTYNCSMNKENLSTDTTAETTYRTAVKPWLLSHLKDVLNLGAHAEASSSLIIEDETFNWNPNNCSFSGSLSAMAPPNDIIEFSESFSQSLDPGITFEKMYDGNDFTYADWGIGQEIQAVQSVVIVKLGSIPADPPSLSNPPWKPIATWNRSDDAEFIGYPGALHSGGESTKQIKYRSTFTRNYLYTQKSIIRKPAYTPSGSAGITGEKEQQGSTINVSVNTSTGNFTIQQKSGGK